MAKEFDLIGLASVGGWLKWRRQHADIPPGTPCGNCGTELAGAYCHTCGQLAENFHKSIWHLFMEVLESFFHFDGRLWRTIPPLIYKPGELTHNFINGKRAYQVPPFRLFLEVQSEAHDSPRQNLLHEYLLFDPARDENRHP